MKATLPSGVLVPIPDCFIDIPDLSITIPMKILPDISDGKSATYSDESGIGRSMPFKSYTNSDNRSIGWTIHWVICKDGDQENIIEWMRALEACVYPQDGDGRATPYAPPPICKLQCGELLSSKDAGPICAVLKSYSIKYDPSVPWDEESLLPYKLDIDLQFDVIYNQAELPGAMKILESGY